MHSLHWSWLFALLAVVLFAAPALAGMSWMPSIVSESRVIHVCIFTMALALFIMLKK